MIKRTTGTASTFVEQPGAMASIVRGSDGQRAVRYRCRAMPAQMLLTVDFRSDEVDALFAQRAGLGDNGEVFLLNGRGEPLDAVTVCPRGIVGARPGTSKRCATAATDRPR